MNWQRARVAVLTSVVLAGVALSVRAEEDNSGHHMAAPAAPAAPLMTSAPVASSCAPAMRTVCVTEWVPEQYETVRTSYRTECVQEAYTAHRTECVPQVSKRIVTVNRMVPEVRQEVRTV